MTTPGDNKRTIGQSQADLMASKRAKERDLGDIVPGRAKNPERRKACEANDALWLSTYLPGVFYNPFTPDQLATIAAGKQALTFGNSKTKCAPRGDGKSTILKYLALKMALSGEIRFVLLICATGPKADDSLKSMKDKLRMAPGTALYDDYEFECAVARYVAPAPARAANATYQGGKPIRVEWSANRLILPTPAESEIGPIIMSMGYESDQLQGCNVFDIRPDFVLLDDLDSRDSLASVQGTVAAKIETIIDQTVAGLGGPGRRLGQFYLGTVTSRRSAAYKYSDPKQKPAWSGERVARLRRWPTNTDLWEQYMALRNKGQETRLDPNDLSSPPVDPFGREAHRFYELHREEMDLGADVTNPYDFESSTLPDGSVKHLTALQKCYDYIADKGMVSFLTEHQNDPPQDEEFSKAGVSRELIRSRLSGLQRRELPPDSIITIGVDLGKYMGHFVAGAFRKGGAGSIIDYGVLEVVGAEKTESLQVIDAAILRALLAWKDQLARDPYQDASGNPVAPSVVLIDSGYSQSAVFEFIRRFGPPFRASHGLGTIFRHGTPSSSRRVGRNWFAQPQAERVWLYSLAADYWKRAVHERFIADPLDQTGAPNPGALTLFIPAGKRDHATYSAHLLAEEFIVQFVPGKGEVSKWHKHSQNNHYFDATAYCLAAAEQAGYGLFSDMAKPAKPRVTLSELKAKAGQR